MALISVSVALSRTHQHLLWDHRYGGCQSRGVHAYAPTLTGTHCAHPQGMARLSWSQCLVTYRHGSPVWRRSPIPVLTKLNVEQFHWWKPTCYHQAKPHFI